MNDRPTFSPFWHRVRTLRPRLRPHVQITRQHYRGGRWHVVHDPASNAFYRLSPVSHEFVGLLDGKRTVEAVWDIILTKHADHAPTQNEAIQLLSQLYTANLLSADVPPETEQLLRRGRERLGQKIRQQAIGLMYFKVRLFNPDRLLTWLEPIARPLLNPIGLLLWAAWVIAAIVTVAVPQWEALRTSFRDAIAPANWAWMLVVFVALKLFHELGHGLICKRFGGHVPEFGAMMLVLVPAPFVDASSAWAFESRWRRIAVGAGGMIFELAAAGLAAHVWSNTAPGLLLHQLAFNAMLTAGVSTVLFNANPLMKFDGYYMLSDLLGIPNLMQRSMAMLKHHFQVHVYRVRNATPPTSDRAEAIALNLFGVAALIYRVFLFVSITLYVMGKLFAIGVILAAWTAAMWFLLPVGQFLHWLATSPTLADKRGRAIVASAIMVVGGFGLIGLIPMPDHRRADGVVTSDARTAVFFGVAGLVEAVHKRPGERVEKDEPIVTLSSPLLTSQLAEARASLKENEARRLYAVAHNPAAAQIADKDVAVSLQVIKVLEERASRLIVRAPHAGSIVGSDPSLKAGAMVEAGQPLCEVVDGDHTHIRLTATLTQEEALWVNELKPEDYTTEVRRLADAAAVIPVRAERVYQFGLRDLPHESLGYAGGGTIETDAGDRSGRRTKRPVFTADFRPTSLVSTPTLYPGERLRFRFTLESKPVLFQWLDRLEKMMQGRAKV